MLRTFDLPYPRQVLNTVLPGMLFLAVVLPWSLLGLSLASFLHNLVTSSGPTPLRSNWLDHPCCHQQPPAMLSFRSPSRCDGLSGRISQADPTEKSEQSHHGNLSDSADPWPLGGGCSPCGPPPLIGIHGGVLRVLCVHHMAAPISLPSSSLHGLDGMGGSSRWRHVTLQLVWPVLLA